MPLSSPPSRPPPRTPSALSYDHGGDTGSIYVTSAVYKAPSDLSRYTVHRTYQSRPRSIYSASSHRTGRSGRSSRSRSRHSRSRTKVEIVRAPNPYCPNLRGVCCIMLLINLGLILLTLGLVIVIQFIEPLFVRWVVSSPTLSHLSIFFFPLQFQNFGNRFSDIRNNHTNRNVCLLRHHVSRRSQTKKANRGGALEEGLAKEHRLHTSRNQLQIRSIRRKILFRSIFGRQNQRKI